MEDNKIALVSVLRRLGWDVEANEKRVGDVLKNKKLTTTVLTIGGHVCIMDNILYPFD